MLFKYFLVGAVNYVNFTDTLMLVEQIKMLENKNLSIKHDVNLAKNSSLIYVFPFVSNMNILRTTKLKIRIRNKFRH